MSKDALLKQYSPVSRAQFNCWEGRVCARVARAQIYAGFGNTLYYNDCSQA